MNPQKLPHDRHECGDVAVEPEIQFHLYSPHPTIQIVIISNHNSPTNRFVPQKMVHLANQAVKKFELNPSQAVWIEHHPSSYNPLSCDVFNLIHFDWQAGRATSPHRSPIHEDWYLSWLNSNLSQNQQPDCIAS